MADLRSVWYCPKCYLNTPHFYKACIAPFRETTRLRDPITGDHVDDSGYKISDNMRAMAGETRITDPVTGGQKGQKLAQLGAIDPNALLELARVAGFGAQKYERNNFLKGYAWSLSFDAMMRHALAFASGEDRDPESGMLHTAHAAWHALALTAFLQRAIGTDDRL